MIILSVILLTFPLLYHLYSDQNGERPSEKTADIIYVSIIALVASLIGYFNTGKPIVDGFILAWAIHFLVFDYAIVYILKRRGVIETKESPFSYLGKSYTDDVLRQWTPVTRLLIKLGVLILAVVIYVL
jgi:hypothetical protein